MKKAIVLLAVLGLVVAANADVRIFFTSSTSAYGIANPANALTPSFGLGLDAASEDADGNPVTPALAVTQFPTYSTEVPTVDAAKGEFVYIWVQFYSTGTAPAPTALPTNGTLFSATLSTQGSPADVAWYRVDNANYDGKLRWQGAATAPDYPEFSNTSMQNLSAVTAYGILNNGTANASQLWSGGANNGTTGRIALLGAIKPSLADAGLDLGITIPTESGTGAPLVAYRSPTAGSYPVTTISGMYHVIPEPASMLLLGLAGLLIRRR